MGESTVDLSYYEIFTPPEVIDRSSSIHDLNGTKPQEHCEQLVRVAYERDDREWLRGAASHYPAVLLAIADAIGLEMPFQTRIWLKDHAASVPKPSLPPPPPPPKRCMDADCYGFQPQVLGGPHWHEFKDGKDAGVNPWDGADPWQPSLKPASPPKPPSVPVAPIGRRCRDCGDLVGNGSFINSHYIRCARCRRAYAEAAEEQARKPITYRCLVCDRQMERAESVCQHCKDSDRYREPAPDMPGLHRNGGGWPHVAFHTNARGESVVRGRVLPHPRYGESVWDRLGDSPDREDV